MYSGTSETCGLPDDPGAREWPRKLIENPTLYGSENGELGC